MRAADHPHDKTMLAETEHFLVQACACGLIHLQMGAALAAAPVAALREQGSLPPLRPVLVN